MNDERRRPIDAEILARFASDLDSGGLKALELYQSAFLGEEARVEQLWRSLHEGGSSETKASTTLRYATQWPR